MMGGSMNAEDLVLNFKKDFWACCALDRQFHRSGFSKSMVFKGGSKPVKGVCQMHSGSSIWGGR